MGAWLPAGEVSVPWGEELRSSLGAVLGSQLSPITCCVVAVHFCIAHFPNHQPVGKGRSLGMLGIPSLETKQI